MSLKSNINKIKKEYYFIGILAAGVLYFMTFSNTFHDFKNNLTEEENPKLLINEKHVIINNSVFLYENDNSIITPINYLAFIEVINNGEKITEIESCKLEVLINSKWIELVLLYREFYNYKDKPSYITDYMYMNNKNNLANCNKIDYYSFTAQAIFNEVKPGQKINGWLPFQWNPILFDNINPIDINKVRYTFKTNQGHSISKIIIPDRKGKKIDEFVNKSFSSWTILGEKYDLSERIIEVPYSKPF